MRAHFDPWSVRRERVLAARARLMRWAPSEPERILWRELRGGKLGVVFRRQVPLCGRYIGDFVAREVRLVVEVDGAHHAARITADARRDAVLRRAGWRVVRIEAEVVMREVAAAIRRIREALVVEVSP